MSKLYLGALEAGGTKMVCSVGTMEGDVLERVSFPTTVPEETMLKIIAFFKDKKISALGVGSFGPLDLQEDSSTYGFITTTPKIPWQQYPMLPTLQEALHLPIAMDTDVNAAAYGEAMLGAAKNVASSLYVTVGTGIGGGLFINGKLVHGLMHPELGHLCIRPEPEDPMPEGICPFHRGCLEGLASGLALARRWGKPAQELPPDHPAWTLEVSYLAQMCANMIVCMSPERIILGGGVMQQPHLFPRIRKQTQQLLGNYIQHPLLLHHIDQYILPPGLGTSSGVIGALLLAREKIR